MTQKPDNSQMATNADDEREWLVSLPQAAVAVLTLAKAAGGIAHLDEALMTWTMADYRAKFAIDYNAWVASVALDRQRNAKTARNGMWLKGGGQTHSSKPYEVHKLCEQLWEYITKEPGTKFWTVSRNDAFCRIHREAMLYEKTETRRFFGVSA